jgi:hypothetical protein
VLTLTLLILAAPPARPTLPNRVSVFVIDKSGGDSGGPEARLTGALDDEKVSLADLDALFPASAPVSVAEKALADAKIAYENLDYDAAAAKYQEALEAIVKSPVGSTSKQLAEAHEFIAIIALQNGGKSQAKKAQEGFVRALVHDPSISVDAKTYGADVKKVFDKAVAEVAKLGKSQLKIETTPGGADATLNGRLLGTTPLADPADLPVGQHLLTFARSGFEPAAVVSELTRDGATASAALTLVPAYADVRTTAGAVVNAIGSGKVPVGARGLAEKMKTRFVLIGSTSGGETTLELWDVESGSQLNGLHVNDDGGYGKVARKVKQFVAAPSAIVAVAEPVAEVKHSTEPGTDEPLYKKWWLWAAVGVVVVGGATAGGIAAANANGHPFNTVLLGSP